MITQELAAYGYLIAAICFIMALRGLSSPVSSRQGNLYGVVGMVVAIGVTVATPGVVSPWLIVGGLLHIRTWSRHFDLSAESETFADGKTGGLLNWNFGTGGSADRRRR